METNLTPELNKEITFYIDNPQEGMELLDKILESIEESPDDILYPYHQKAFCYKHSDTLFIAVDNRTCNCWVEEFKTLELAKTWLYDEESTA